jgi:hypothetical protein
VHALAPGATGIAANLEKPSNRRKHSPGRKPLSHVAAILPVTARAVSMALNPATGSCLYDRSPHKAIKHDMRCRAPLLT